MVCFSLCAFVDRGRMYIAYYVKAVWASIRTTRVPRVESPTMEKFPSALARLSVRLLKTTRKENMYLNLGEKEIVEMISIQILPVFMKLQIPKKMNEVISM